MNLENIPAFCQFVAFRIMSEGVPSPLGAAAKVDALLAVLQI